MLMGGFALSVWGRVRVTQDVDVSLGLSPHDEPALLNALRRAHFLPATPLLVNVYNSWYEPLYFLQPMWHTYREMTQRPFRRFIAVVAALSLGVAGPLPAYAMRVSETAEGSGLEELGRTLGVASTAAPGPRPAIATHSTAGMEEGSRGRRSNRIQLPGNANPKAIAVAATGRLYVVDNLMDSQSASGTRRKIRVGSLKPFTKRGEPIRFAQLPAQVPGVPVALAVGSDGVVYVGVAAGSVFAFTDTGKPVALPIHDVTGLSALATSPGKSYRVYVGTTGSRVLAYTSRGTSIPFPIPEIGSPVVALAVAHDGTVYVGTGDGRILSFTETGRAAAFPVSAIRGLRALVVTQGQPSHSLYVARGPATTDQSTKAGHVTGYTSTGQSTGFHADAYNPMALAVDSEGTLYVAEGRVGSTAGLVRAIPAHRLRATTLTEPGGLKSGQRSSQVPPPAAGMEETPLAPLTFGHERVWNDERTRTKKLIDNAMDLLRARAGEFGVAYPHLYDASVVAPNILHLRDLWASIQADMDGSPNVGVPIAQLRVVQEGLQQQRFGAVLWGPEVSSKRWSEAPYNAVQALLNSEVAEALGFFKEPDNPLTDPLKAGRDKKQHDALMSAAGPTLPGYTAFILGEHAPETLAGLARAEKQAVLRRAALLVLRGNAEDTNLLGKLTVSGAASGTDVAEMERRLIVNNLDAAVEDLTNDAIREVVFVQDNVGTELLGLTLLTAIYLQMYPEKKVTWVAKVAPYLASDVTRQDLEGWKTEVPGVDGRSWFVRFQDREYTAGDPRVAVLLQGMDRFRGDLARFEVLTPPWTDTGLPGSAIPQDLGQRLGGEHRMTVFLGEWLNERLCNGIPYNPATSPMGTSFETAWGYLRALGIRTLSAWRVVKDNFIVVIPPEAQAHLPREAINPDGSIKEGGHWGMISHARFAAGMEEGAQAALHKAEAARVTAIELIERSLAQVPSNQFHSVVISREMLEAKGLLSYATLLQRVPALQGRVAIIPSSKGLSIMGFAVQLSEIGDALHQAALPVMFYARPTDLAVSTLEKELADRDITHKFVDAAVLASATEQLLRELLRTLGLPESGLEEITQQMRTAVDLGQLA